MTYLSFLCVFQHYFFRKSVFFVGTPSYKRIFERTCADCRISGEKGFASRLNNSLDWWDKAPFFCAYAKEVLLRGFDDFSFFVVLLRRKRKAVYDRTFHKWNKPSLTADKPGRMILSIRPNTFGQTDKNIYNRGIQMYRFPNSDGQKSVIFEGIKKRLKIV